MSYMHGERVVTTMMQ